MEPTDLPEDDPARAGAARSELRSLSRLRDRVLAAAEEVERLREENAALAGRLAALEAGGPSFAFGEADDPEALKETVRGFIDVVDRLLSGETGGDGAAGS